MLSYFREFWYKILSALKVLSFVWKYKKLILICGGCIFESSASIIGLGAVLENFKEYFFFVVCTSIFATFVDITMMEIISRFFKNKYKNPEEEGKFLKFCRKHFFLGTLFYRFVPFGRVPFLISAAAVVPVQNFVLPNLMGAFIWSVAWISIGYNNIIRTFFKYITSSLLSVFSF